MFRMFLLAILVFSFAKFNTAQKPSYGILFDNTGSMRTQLETEIQLAQEIAKQAEDGSPVSLFRFETGPRGSETANMQVVLTCSMDRAVLKKSIENLYILGGQTTLLDAINSSAEILSAKSDKCGETTDRRLILITDGENRISKIGATELIASLKKNNIKVYALGLVDDLSDDRVIGGSLRSKAKRFLEEITNETGGKLVYPKRGQKAEETIKNLFATESKTSK